MPITVGDGSYPIGPPDGIFDTGPVHIPPGRYISNGPLAPGAFFRVYGPPTLDAGGQGILCTSDDALYAGEGPLIIDIGLQAYWFDTVGYDSWIRLEGPHPFYMRMPGNFWRDISPTASVFPVPQVPSSGYRPGQYQPFPFAMRRIAIPSGTSLSDDERSYWMYQHPYGSAVLRVRMPDGTWCEETRLETTPFDTTGGVMFLLQEGYLGGYTNSFPRPALDGSRYETWGWQRHAWAYGEEYNPFGDPEFTGTGYEEGPLAGGFVESTVSRNYTTLHTPDGFNFDIRRRWVTIDLDVCRWLNNIFNPYGVLIPGLLIRGSSGRIDRDADDNNFYVDGGTMRLAYADFGSAIEPITVFTNWDPVWQVPGAAPVPALWHTGPPSLGSLIHTFAGHYSSTTPGQPVQEDVHVPLDLTSDARSLSFEMTAQLPDLPADMESAGVAGDANFYFQLT